MSEIISNESWKSLSESLNIEEETLRAVAQVESAGSGFIEPGMPKILFEGHCFHRLTQGRFDKDHPTLSYPKWTKQFYSNARGEWKRLDEACALDRAAALQSASWGAFQIMGFNYNWCGFSNVEAFVAAQKASIESQLESFARFISREMYLKPLRAHDWAGFAKVYNGSGYALNKYDQKLAAAYAAAKAAKVAPASAKAKKKVAPPKTKSPKTKSTKTKSTVETEIALGRPEFALMASGDENTRRRQPRRRTVRPDSVDLRDWLYRPTIARAPKERLMLPPPRPTSDQKDTNACTGFALAKAIEYLLLLAGRDVEEISAHMLYDMARRYDEWATNDEDDAGSSIRGALKGWSRHGASAARLWPKLKMPWPKKDGKPEDDWWVDSVKRPLGAYFRVSCNVESDLHSALNEAGVLYASALTHAGWDALNVDSEQLPPESADDNIPIIECRKGLPDAGHAFIIVGYTAKGFIVQNSWGPKWGRGGFAILTYADWRQNAMDCWVVQLGVVTEEHKVVSEVRTLRVEERTSVAAGSVAGRVVLSTDLELANHEISPFVIDMQNDGELSNRGRFRTGDGDLELMLDQHLQDAAALWKIGAQDTLDVAIYAHGGLVGEDDAAATARQWIPLFYSNRIFPIFLMWETDALSTILNIIDDTFSREEAAAGAGFWQRFKSAFSDWKDQRVEGLTRLPGGAMWRQMKDNAEKMSRNKKSGVIKLFNLFQDRVAQNKMPKIRLHLVGHSAGSIVHSHLAARAIEQGFDLASISFLAPAVRVHEFDSLLGGVLSKKKVRVLVTYLNDAAELADPTCKPYGHSLLYLVSRAFEKENNAAILGMEKFLVPTVAAQEWGARVSRLVSPGGRFTPDGAATTASDHSGVDDDIVVQDSVIRHIKNSKDMRVVRSNWALEAQPRK